MAKKTGAEFEKYLVERDILTKAQVQSTQKEAKSSKTSFKKACLKLKLMTEEIYGVHEASFLEIPFVNIQDYTIDESALKQIVPQLARSQGVFPLFLIDKILTIAAFDPHNVIAIDQIRETTKMTIDVVLSTESDIQRAIKEYYGIIGTGLAEESKPKTGAGRLGPRPSVTGAPQAVQESKVVRLIDEAILQALEDGASDIHIEPEEGFIRIRNRVDGVLAEVAQLSKDLQSALISRVKILAKLDIGENRKPQDGRIQIKLENRQADIRVSTFPTTHGENIVMRILEQSSIDLDLNKLGFEKDLVKRFEALLKRPYGIILVTGPTGAGKTTTLYAALKSINTVDRNIMTVEDPIEYRLNMVRQTQVNPKAGLTFASGLRSILRQDPDVILVGEIRDRETAEIAIQAALTGHLVFSTLHTNDAPGAITRLADMGIEPFLISSAVVGVLAQRLVRVICPSCRKKDVIQKSQLNEIDLEIVKNVEKSGGGRALSVYKGQGCKSCGQRGYRGRSGIYELMTVNDSIRQQIVERASANQIRKAWLENGQSLKFDGYLKALQGKTTIEEILRVTQE